MKYIKRFFKGLLLLLGLIILLLYIFDYDYILKGVRVVYLKGYTSAYIDDYPSFDNRTIKKGETVIAWKQHPGYNTATATDKLIATNEKYGTVAYLIIKDDQIWYEKYEEGYGVSSKTNSFSMAKSIVTLLLGKAIADGYVKNLEQPIGDFLPEFSEGIAAKVTVGDLSSMSSGLDWTEHYTSPFSITARTYYDDDIRPIFKNLKIIEEPGKSYKYLSGNTQLLAMVLEKATGKNLSDYLSESLWKPLGMQQDALWQLDSEENGMEKAYCCISSNARDFAKFGVLMNHEGMFNGRQIIPKEFVDIATNPRFGNGTPYGYGYWLSNHMGKKIFLMRGILGQYVISIPEDNLVIVRLGHKRGVFEGDKDFTDDFYVYVEEAYKMLENASQN
ncbi:serine hydrolase [Aquimarina sp. TRL1]|uniref:serine hydrolase domain-containing protein n=1 Tax=Aquimarina sp. (strain TRL1) TaxID=2736252 RepID=UPI00158B8A69|nr:serine hydrolase [Aquimarina sp. TRL1]QKX04847.1 serine hydrolase [Aquimarina sp. TRL1]